MRLNYDQLIASRQSVYDAQGKKVPSVRWAENVDGGVLVSLIVRPKTEGEKLQAPLCGKVDGELEIAEFSGVIKGGAIGPS